MPDSAPPVDLLRIDAHAAYAVHVRFPPGFRRPVAGGYRVGESFMMLRGTLELDEWRFQPGDLAHIPARRVRSSMVTSEGAWVLAWFLGPPDWFQAEDLDGDSTEPIVRSALDAAPVGPVMRTPEAVWRVGVVEQLDVAASDDVVDLAGRCWSRGSTVNYPPGTRVLVRSPLSAPVDRQ